jgi:hypothetical protein
MLIAIDNICFNVEYDYNAAHDGGGVEDSWPEYVVLYAVTLFNMVETDLLPFLNEITVKELEKEVIRHIHNRSLP